MFRLGLTQVATSLRRTLFAVVRQTARPQRTRPSAHSSKSDASSIVPCHSTRVGHFFSRRNHPAMTDSNPIFYINKLKDITQSEGNHFLLKVAHGKQDDAEIMLRNKPALVYYTGDLIDYSLRHFKEITGLRYAAWALDWYMCFMLLQYIPKEEAYRQLRHLEIHGTDHGRQFEFTELIQTLQVYLDNFDTWTCEQLGIQWCRAIGGAQTRAVVHVINQLCHPHRSLVPQPNFDEPSLARSLTLVDGSEFFPLEPKPAGVIGEDFAIFRWNKPAAGIGTMKPCPNARITAVVDLAAMRHLECVSNLRLHDIRQQLGVIHAPPRLRRLC